MWIFYANFFDINNEQHSFYMIVNRVVLKVNPNFIFRLLGVPCAINNAIAFPIHKLTMEQKSARVER